MAQLGPSVSHGPYGGVRVTGAAPVPVDRPFTYGNIYFRTQAERDRYANVRSLYSQVRAHKLPWTVEGIRQYRRKRAEAISESTFNVTMKNAKREVSKRIREKYGLKADGPLPKKYREEYERELTAHFKYLRKLGQL